MKTNKAKQRAKKIAKAKHSAKVKKERDAKRLTQELAEAHEWLLGADEETIEAIKTVAMAKAAKELEWERVVRLCNVLLATYFVLLDATDYLHVKANNDGQSSSSIKIEFKDELSEEHVDMSVDEIGTKMRRAFGCSLVNLPIQRVNLLQFRGSKQNERACVQLLKSLFPSIDFKTNKKSIVVNISEYPTLAELQSNSKKLEADIRFSYKSNEYIIEVQGEQHYDIDRHQQTVSSFNELQIRDKLRSMSTCLIYQLLWFNTIIVYLRCMRYSAF